MSNKFPDVTEAAGPGTTFSILRQNSEMGRSNFHCHCDWEQSWQLVVENKGIKSPAVYSRFLHNRNGIV